MLPINCGLAQCWYLASHLGLRMTPLGWDVAMVVNSYVGLFVLIHSSAQHAVLGDFPPGLHIPWKSSSLHSLDSDQRLLRDEVCWGWTLLWFNYLFWRPAFECRSLRLSEFLWRLFDFLLSWTKNDHMLGGKEQNKHLESITKIK